MTLISNICFLKMFSYKFSKKDFMYEFMFIEKGTLLQTFFIDFFKQLFYKTPRNDCFFAIGEQF